MKTYLITYDLHKPGQQYEDLYKAIEKLGEWWHCLGSVWIVKSGLTATQIRDSLRSHHDSNDSVLVVLLSGEGAWAGFSEQCSSWLESNL